MSEMEFLQMIGKESVVFVAIFVVYYLFVRPKDSQINELLETNKQVVQENSETLADISATMEKISCELTNLNDNQVKLKEGQDELWREIIFLKKER